MNPPLIPMAVGMPRVGIRKNIIEYDQKEAENASFTNKMTIVHCNYFSIMDDTC